MYQDKAIILKDTCRILKNLCIPAADLTGNLHAHIVKVKVKSLSHIHLFATPWTVAHQAPSSMGFSRQEYWIGCHAILQGIFPTQGSNPDLLCLLCWQKGSLPLAPPGKPENILEWVSEVTQSCPTVCDPMDCRPPGFSVHGILQSRTLEWVAITSSKLLISYCENICTFFKRLMSLQFEMLLLSQYIHKHMNTFRFKQLIDNVEGF